MLLLTLAGDDKFRRINPSPVRALAPKWASNANWASPHFRNSI